MRTTSPHERTTEWAVALGILTGGANITRAEAELKLKAYVPMLTEHFPPAAFTQVSLHHVAAQCKWFPSYAEVVTHLRAWWRENRPIHNALQAPPQRADSEPEREPPTDDERAYVRQRVAEITAHLRDADTAHALKPSRDIGPRHLTPAQLDVVNPLPNGQKRTPTDRSGVPQ